MPSIDIHRENLKSKKKELIALQEEKSEQEIKSVDLLKKIDKTRRAGQGSKSESALKSSLNAMRRLEKNNTKIQEKINAINKQIASKEKEIMIEQGKVSKEEINE